MTIVKIRKLLKSNIGKLLIIERMLDNTSKLPAIAIVIMFLLGTSGLISGSTSADGDVCKIYTYDPRNNSEVDGAGFVRGSVDPPQSDLVMVVRTRGETTWRVQNPIEVGEDDGDFVAWAEYHGAKDKWYEIVIVGNPIDSYRSGDILPRIPDGSCQTKPLDVLSRKSTTSPG